MFEELFTRSKTIEEYQTAPLADERLRYIVHCSERGARRSTLRRTAVHQLALVRLLDLHEGDRVSLARIHAAAREWSGPGVHWYGRRASAEATTRFVGHAIRWLRFLGWLDEPEKARHPHAAEVAAYVLWMREERGFSEETIKGCCVAVDGFFDRLAAENILLAAIRITDIDRVIAAWHARKDYSRVTIRDYVERLRAFFRFAEDRRWCSSGMAATIRPPRVYPDEKIPQGLAREDILRLLATTEGDRPADMRDRAILMLLVAYGLRAAEVGGLRLDCGATIKMRLSDNQGKNFLTLRSGFK